MLKKFYLFTATIFLLVPVNAMATEWYVSQTGNDSTGLTLSEAFTSINKAADKANPGDIIWVADGTYKEEVFVKNSGDPEKGWITFKAINQHAAKIRVDGEWSSGFTIMANYIIIDSFDLEASGTNGLGITTTAGQHHITAINNYMHGCGESGFGSVDSDYLVVENNIIARNSLLSPYCGSGISLYGAFRFDDEPGFHNIVRNNICFDNDNSPTFEDPTDGNGIIIDDLRGVQKYHDFSVVTPEGYNGIETLVEGNLCINNGGRGIQVFLSNNVTVRNNTCYNNNTRDDDNTWRAEIGIANSSDVSLINNIAVCNTNMGFPTSSHNTGLFVGQFGGYNCKNIIWANNQTYNIADPEDDAHHMGNSAQVSSLTDNLFGCDPLFVNSSTDLAVADFRLQYTSSAINSGTQAFGAGTIDLEGNQRVISVIDRGAYESSSTAAPMPCEGVR